MHLEVKNTGHPTLTDHAPPEAALILRVRVPFLHHPPHTVIFLGLLNIDIYRPCPQLVSPRDNPR